MFREELPISSLVLGGIGRKIGCKLVKNIKNKLLIKNQVENLYLGLKIEQKNKLDTCKTSQYPFCKGVNPSSPKA